MAFGDSYSRRGPRYYLDTSAFDIFDKFFLYKEFQKMVVISFKDLEKISNFTKFHDCGSKTELATPISDLNLNCL